MKLAALLFLLMLPVFVSAQALWRKGEIVMKDGTRLSGFINDREWVVNPDEIEFREEGKDVQKFTATLLQEFSTDRPVRYKSFLVSYDGDGQAMNNLPPLREPTIVVKDQVLLEVLIDSRYSLLYLQEKSGRKHFFIEEGGEPKELVDRLYGSNGNSQHYALYKQQLTIITNDCPDLQSQISKLKYYESQLRSFFKDLNECKGAPVIMKDAGANPAIKKRPSFGIAVQPFLSQIDYMHGYYDVWGNYTDGILRSGMGSVNFSFGAFAEFYDRKRPNRLSLYNELAYQSVSQEYFSYQGVGLLIAGRLSAPGKVGGRRYFIFGLNNLYKMNAIMEDLPGGVADQAPEDEYTLGGMLGIGKTVSLGPVDTNLELRYTFDKMHTGSTSFNGAHNIGFSIQVSLKK